MLVRYLVLRSLQSFGRTFSSCETVKASGYTAFLSTDMENGGLLWLALITFLKNRFTAGISRFALNINSIVFPSLSMARHRYWLCCENYLRCNKFVNGSKLSRYYEEALDKLRLAHCVTSISPLDLTFPHHIHRFNTFECSLRHVKIL